MKLQFTEGGEYKNKQAIKRGGLGLEKNICSWNQWVIMWNATQMFTLRLSSQTLSDREIKTVSLEMRWDAGEYTTQLISPEIRDTGGSPHIVRAVLTPVCPPPPSDYSVVSHLEQSSVVRWGWDVLSYQFISYKKCLRIFAKCWPPPWFASLSLSQLLQMETSGL